MVSLSFFVSEPGVNLAVWSYLNLGGLDNAKWIAIPVLVPFRIRAPSSSAILGESPKLPDAYGPSRTGESTGSVSR